MIEQCLGCLEGLWMVSGGFLDTVWLVLDIAKKKELSYHHTQMPLIRPRLLDLGVSGRCLKGVWKMLSQILIQPGGILCQNS